MIIFKPSNNFEGQIIYETVDLKSYRDTMTEYYSGNRLLTVYSENSPLFKHLVIVEDNGHLINYVQTRATEQWNKFTVSTNKIDRPVFFNSNDSMVILNNVCRAIEFKATKTINQKVTILKTVKSYLSDNLYFYLTPDSTDALNRIQLYRETRTSSTNGVYDNLVKRKAIQIIHTKPNEKLFEIPKDFEEVKTKD